MSHGDGICPDPPGPTSIRARPKSIKHEVQDHSKSSVHRQFRGIVINRFVDIFPPLCPELASFDNRPYHVHHRRVILLGSSSLKVPNSFFTPKGNNDLNEFELPKCLSLGTPFVVIKFLRIAIIIIKSFNITDSLCFIVRALTAFVYHIQCLATTN
ncbi:hypothetical protein BCR42DRAFT_423679 [Absidia repens]|uniref:Uncharacterized protein n=1 Tax=Absidia repens TaxID=90262 RepID=A0A1X2I568_9FUNG|nr:hypothetical protein BCR42DRAFT_423679 [Absidia repens]